MHVDQDLSAYLDAELPLAERARVEAHVASCERCRAHLADLTATAHLVAALPSPRPSRSLVPRVTERWNGVRLLRSISAVATGAFLLAFLVTAVGRTGTGLGGGDASTAIFSGSGAAAPAATAAAPAAARLSASAAPAPAATGAAAGAAQSPAPTQIPGADSAKAPASPVPQYFAPAPQSVAAGASEAARSAQGPATVRTAASTRPFLEPFFWLALAVLAALAVLGSHLALRAR